MGKNFHYILIVERNITSPEFVLKNICAIFFITEESSMVIS